MPPEPTPSFLEIPHGIAEYEALFFPASLPGSSLPVWNSLKHGERPL